MEVFVLFGIVIWVLITLFNHLKEKPPSRTTRDPNLYRPSTHTSQRSPDTSSERTKRDPSIYRPSTSTRKQTRPAIKFKVNDSRAGSTTDLGIKDLVDVLTGAPLQLALGLYQCQRCDVFYQTQSFLVIQSVRDGQCVSCQQKGTIVNVASRSDLRGQNANVSAITLVNYHKYAGNVITFEGYVHNVLTSRRGTDYAVMFENKSWVHGLKMVVFPECVNRIGGYDYLNSLRGHLVRVRGLLNQHDRYGYQIIVSDRSMILDVQ